MTGRDRVYRETGSLTGMNAWTPVIHRFLLGCFVSSRLNRVAPKLLIQFPYSHFQWILTIITPWFFQENPYIWISIHHFAKWMRDRDSLSAGEQYKMGVLISTCSICRAEVNLGVREFCFAHKNTLYEKKLFVISLTVKKTEGLTTWKGQTWQLLLMGQVILPCKHVTLW